MCVIMEIICACLCGYICISGCLWHDGGFCVHVLFACMYVHMCTCVCVGGVILPRLGTSFSIGIYHYQQLGKSRKWKEHTKDLNWNVMNLNRFCSLISVLHSPPLSSPYLSSMCSQALLRGCQGRSLLSII